MGSIKMCHLGLWSCLALLLPVHSSQSSQTALTPETFHEATAGRNVFIKFYDPGCSHCRSMAAAWDKLEEAWRDDSLVLVASVNCRASIATERWCEREMNIHGLPTLLFGEPSYKGAFLGSYGDDKTFVAMDQFVKDRLAEKPICSAGNMDACDPEVKEKLISYWKLSESQLESEIEAKRADIKSIQENFQAEFAVMQQAYDKSVASHELLKSKLTANLTMLKSAIVAKK